MITVEIFSRARAIFEAAGDRPAAEREAHVQRACAGDAELLALVREMLAAAEEADARGFLGTPTAGVATNAALSEGPGTQIGPYKLLEQIGEGGFGAVFLAEQARPVVRRVALKIIKLGMDTRQVIARFEAERQALAMMDHPNIAKVFDAGATDTGRPYFVMELVRGDPITGYCDANTLGVNGRLQLFTQVCHAVQHAHQKGVIHRDLKPSNVLVTVADGRPISKVIDFGIAKATFARLTEKTLLTEHRGLIGTPEYMSPEQAGLAEADIDTRSDVYSLGVLLYELLTGRTPFDRERLRSVGLDELFRIIREDEPPKPSTRLARLFGTADGAAPPARAGDSSLLERRLRNELDWIVMKCLEKDRTRRYETAHTLALEVDRYLNHEPVLAGPPSRAYRFRKFVRRNRVMVAAAGLVTAALLAGIAGTSYGLVRAEHRRAEAQQARQLAETRERETRQVSDFQAAILREIDIEKMGRGIMEGLRTRVEAALQRQSVGEGASRRVRTAEEVQAELVALDQLAAGVQGADVARAAVDQFVLATAADAMEKQFADQPLVRARLHLALGQAYRELGLYSPAERHLRACLEIRESHYGPGATHNEVAWPMHNLAAVLGDQDKQQEAEARWQEAIAIWRALADQEHISMALAGLGRTLFRQSRTEEAEARLQEALRIDREHLPADHDLVIEHTGALAAVMTEPGRVADAESLNREVLRWRREHLGEKHPQVGHSFYNLGAALQQQGKFAEAQAAFSEALAIYRAAYGDVHPFVAKTRSKLGYQLMQLDQPKEAEACLLQALAQQRELLGDTAQDVRQTLQRLSQLRQRLGDDQGAVTVLRELLAATQQVFPEGHPESFHRFGVMAMLGRGLARQGAALVPTDRAHALTLFEEGDLFIRAGMAGMMADRRSGSVANQRQALKQLAETYDFWESVAPGRGWAEQAAAWWAQLEGLPAP